MQQIEEQELESAMHSARGSLSFTSWFLIGFATLGCGLMLLIALHEPEAGGAGLFARCVMVFGGAVVSGALPGLFLFFAAYALMRSVSLGSGLEKLLKAVTCVFGFFCLLFFVLLIISFMVDLKSDNSVLFSLTFVFATPIALAYISYKILGALHS